MLKNLKQQRQRYGLKTYLKRTMTRELDKLLYRVDRDRMIKEFRRLGLTRGAVVCVHSSLSRLGYVDGGADAVIDAVLEVIGPQGCMLMPAFSTAGSMASYIESREVFDVRKTPSRVGAVTEIFRTRPGVKRSLHPTNSLAALGRGADELLEGHENSLSPYGRLTPYGKLAERDDSFILMLETHVQSLLHHLQERVDFPNLFLPEQKSAKIRDEQGNEREVRTNLMRPHVPYFIAVPSGRGEPDWIVLHDFALMFPASRQDELAAVGARFPGYPTAYNRRKQLEGQGILKAGRLGKGEVGLLKVKEYLTVVEPELREIIEQYRPYYVPEKLAGLKYY